MRLLYIAAFAIIRLHRLGPTCNFIVHRIERYALLSMAIHGLLLPDKLLVTFLLGVIATVYYLKERNFVPLFITHWIVDLWSFGLFMFG